MTEPCIRVHTAKCKCEECIAALEPTLNEMDEYLIKKKHDIRMEPHKAHYLTRFKDGKLHCRYKGCTYTK